MVLVSYVAHSEIGLLFRKKLKPLFYRQLRHKNIDNIGKIVYIIGKWLPICCDLNYRQPIAYCQEATCNYRQLVSCFKLTKPVQRLEMRYCYDIW